jgi:hypothetical protein
MFVAKLAVARNRAWGVLLECGKMTRPASLDEQKASPFVRQHLDWLEKDIDALLDAEFLENAKTPINRKEIARLRRLIDDLKTIVDRYRSLGLC